MTDGEPDIALFSYGTLQLPEVQRATCGRLIEGSPDILAGYRLEPLVISSPGAVAVSGREVHTIARRTGDPVDLVPGLVLMVTSAELEEIDRYETDAYDRVEVRLESGAGAFVYVGPDMEPNQPPSAASPA